MDAEFGEAIDEIKKLTELIVSSALAIDMHCNDLLAPFVDAQDKVEMGHEFVDDAAGDELTITKEEEYEFMHPGYALTWDSDNELIYGELRSLAKADGVWDAEEFYKDYNGDDEELYHGLTGFYPHIVQLLPYPEQTGTTVIEHYLGPDAFAAVPDGAYDQFDAIYTAEYYYWRDKTIKNLCGHFV